MKAREDLLVRAAELYFDQGLSQNDVANILGVSRPTVSRLLDEAKATGVVEIRVNSPIAKNPTLSAEVRNRFELKDAIVLKGAYGYQQSLFRCSRAALSFCETILERSMTIGTSWGAVPSYLCDILETSEIDHSLFNIDIVQMVGCLGTGNPDVDGIAIALKLAKAFGGTYSNIYAPVFVQYKEVYDFLLKEPQIAQTLKKCEHLDIVIMGIGSFDRSTILQKAGYLNDSSRQALIEAGAVGHLLARPFDKDGNEILNDSRHTVGAPLSSTRNAKWSICVSAAEFKAPALHAAIRGGYTNVVVIDEPLANALIALDNEA